MNQTLRFSKIQIVKRKDEKPSEVIITDPQDSEVKFIYSSEKNELSAVSTETGDELAHVICSRMDL